MTTPYVTIIIIGQPRGKGRHRSRIVKPAFKKPFISNYPDPNTERYERRIGQEALLAMREKPPINEAVCLWVEAYFLVPTSWSKSKRIQALSGVIRPTTRPDWDNLGKITDSLKTIVWRDDALVVEGRVRKFYAEQPRTEIRVWKASQTLETAPTDPLSEPGSLR